MEKLAVHCYGYDGCSQIPRFSRCYKICKTLHLSLSIRTDGTGPQGVARDQGDLKKKTAMGAADAYDPVSPTPALFY